jgi:translocation and assembly module TamB
MGVPTTQKTQTGWKRWAKRALLAAALLLLVAGIALAWLLHSESGARFALSLAPRELAVGSMSGTLSGPLTLNNVRYAQAGVQASLARGTLDLQWQPLLSNRLILDALTLEGLEVQLSDAPAPPTSVAAATAPAPVLVLRNVALKSIRVTRMPAAGATAALKAETLVDIGSASAKLLQLEGDALTLQELAIAEARGTLSADGTLDLSGKTASSLNFAAHAVQPDVALTGSLAGTPARLRADVVASMRANGKGDGLADSVAFNGELMALNTAALRWRGVLKSAGVNLAALGVTGPVQQVHFDLNGEGGLAQAKLSGALSLDADAFTLRAADIGWGESALTVRAFELGLPSGGSLQASGSWPLSNSASAPGAMALQWRTLSLPERFGWPKGFVSEEGSVRLSGHTGKLSAELDFALAQAATAANAALAGRIKASVQRNLDANSDIFTLAPLRVENSDGGYLAASGDVVLPVAANAPLRWQLDLDAKDLNPALVAPEWPGLVGFSARSEGRLQLSCSPVCQGKQDDKPVASVTISSLAGVLKNQPLSGSGALKFAKSYQPTGTLALRWGANSAEFAAPTAGDVQANVDIATLGALIPNASGSLVGNVSLRQVGTGKASTTAVAANLQGRLISVGDVRAENLDVQAQIPSQLTQPLTLEIQASNAELAGQVLRSTQISVQGTRAEHTLSAAIEHANGGLSLAASGGLGTRGKLDTWTGMLNSLSVRPVVASATKRGAKAPELTLLAPAALSLSAANASLQRACLQGAGLDFCTAVNWARVGASALSVDLNALDVAALEAALGGLAEGVRGVLAGTISASLNNGELVALNANIAPLSDQPIQASIARADADDVTLKFTEFAVAANALGAGAPTLNLSLALQNAGTLRATGLSVGDTLRGELNIDLTSLQAFSGLSEAVVNPTGQVSGTLNLSGTAAAPIIAGRLNAKALGMELPAAGLKLANGLIDISSDGSKLNVDGAVQSGKGTLKIAGWLAPFETAKVELQLQGTDVLLADIPSARVVASPNLTIAHDGTQIKVKGTLALPSANLQLDRFESGVTRSADVVVLDDVKAAPGTPVRADVTVSLGEDVTLKGFGLNGKLSGQLRVRERPNKTGTARGEIEVKGTYKAYGQDLLIERGKLLFSSTPLDDPGLDIRALRKIEQTKAGVQVRGTALRPELTVWSDPVMEQYDVLSMIVTGQTLRGASSDQKALVANAGGNFLAQGIGKKVGLELGVETLSDVGGPAFTAGKYLSPALYVGYGQGLFNPQTLFILRYRLFERYELEGLSGREQKIGVNYRREK